MWIAAHRALHRLPFEALVVDVVDGKPRYWLDDGPPIAYVHSGSAMGWLRKRAKEARDEPGLDLLVVGDPSATRSPSSPRKRSAELAPQIRDIERAGDLERIRELPQLRGAREEATAIAALFREANSDEASVRVLLGTAATESAVFDRAAHTKILHFACHGIAEEFLGQSFSMLVLAQPEQALPHDDGLLKLDDLLQRWRGRLSSCRLVVLSACRTNVGRLYRDESPQALPLGFLYAGASAVIPSLWAVDDASTKELMTDFYRRLLAGESDRLAAFTAAKKALRRRHPDPYHWAPFLYIGSPQ